MNKILIIYINNEAFFYMWDMPVDVDYILQEWTAVKNFDLIETVLDLDTYQKLYYENLYNIR